MSDQTAVPATKNEMDTRSNLYTPLSGTRSIRLVRISPGDEGSMLCSLVPAGLDDTDTSYLALSYAWGDPKKTQAISCNGEEFQATESLVGAMKQLRKLYPGRPFWIDAICINQQDLAERSAQVQLMRDIYKSAENVVIYLGEYCNGLDRAMDLFNRLDKEAIVWEADKKAENSRDIRDRFPAVYDEVWYRFHNLFNRPWFSRIWIIQEVVMASGDPDVLCGPFKLSWSTVVRVSNFFQYVGFSGATIRKSRTSHVGLVENIRQGPRSLWTLLWYSSSFASTEPRDRVFALYGLVHPAETNTLLASEYFKIDYQTSVKDVFRDMMFGYIMHYGYLDLMSEAMEVSEEDAEEDAVESGQWSKAWTTDRDVPSIPVTAKHSRIEGLPSWVPDWTLPPTLKHPGIGKLALYAGYEACGGKQTMIHSGLRSSNPDVLRIAGKAHATVEWVSDPLDDVDYSPLPWRRHPFVLEKLWAHVRGRLGSTRETTSAFWRTLLANADKEGYPLKDEMYPSFLRFWHDSKTHDQYASRYISNNQGHLLPTEEEERELFKTYGEDYTNAVTEEDFQAMLKLYASRFPPCTSTPECAHCMVMASPVPEGKRITGPSPALSQKDSDPFLSDFFGALGQDHRLVTCAPEMDILTRMRHTLRHRTFFITKCGLQGIGPKHTRIGDTVAVLTGSRVPFVLRETGTFNVLPEIDVGYRLIPQYRVVGDSYVHGIMTGEAVRDLDWEGGGYEVIDLI